MEEQIKNLTLQNIALRARIIRKDKIIARMEENMLLSSKVMEAYDAKIERLKNEITRLKTELRRFYPEHKPVVGAISREEFLEMKMKEKAVRRVRFET